MCLRKLSPWVYSVISAHASALDKPIVTSRKTTNYELPTTNRHLPAGRDHLLISGRDRELRGIRRRGADGDRFAADLVSRHDARSERDAQRKTSPGREGLDTGNRGEGLQRAKHRRVAGPRKRVG